MSKEYIEREAAIEAAKHAWAKGIEPSQYIEIIPTSDVAPVVHGEWIERACRPTCSLCGFSGSLIDAPISPFKYCPKLRRKDGRCGEISERWRGGQGIER